jgi:hypothetical protein
MITTDDISTNIAIPSFDPMATVRGIKQTFVINKGKNTFLVQFSFSELAVSPYPATTLQIQTTLADMLRISAQLHLAGNIYRPVMEQQLKNFFRKKGWTIQD